MRSLHLANKPWQASAATHPHELVRQINGHDARAAAHATLRFQTTTLSCEPLMSSATATESRVFFPSSGMLATSIR